MRAQNNQNPRQKSGELLTRQEGAPANLAARRIALALGPQPVPNARHLLAPVPLPALLPPLPPGPHPGTEFVVEISGVSPHTVGKLRRAVSNGLVQQTLGPPQVWAQTAKRDGTAGPWQPLEDAADFANVSVLAFAWQLTGLLVSDGADAAAELARGATAVGEIAARLGWSVTTSRETPAKAGLRAVRLIALKDRFARSVEMRLLPTGRRFPARDVWRSAYALGLRWGDLDLFHWADPVTGQRLFTLSAAGGGPTYFLPERAAEGETTAGLILSFELPTSPAPIAAYDRMAVALDYLRQTLGGRPTTPDGAELDGDRLWDDRDALENAVREMEQAGIAPGSPAAARFF